jgi:hypothetical protein
LWPVSGWNIYFQQIPEKGVENLKMMGSNESVSSVANPYSEEPL